MHVRTYAWIRLFICVVPLRVSTLAAGACLNIAACALNSPLCPGLQAPAIVWAPEGQPTATQHVSWGELRGRCMHTAAAIAARFPPGGYSSRNDI